MLFWSVFSCLSLHTTTRQTSRPRCSTLHPSSLLPRHRFTTTRPPSHPNQVQPMIRTAACLCGYFSDTSPMFHLRPGRPLLPWRNPIRHRSWNPVPCRHFISNCTCYMLRDCHGQLTVRTQPSTTARTTSIAPFRVYVGDVAWDGG